MAFATPRTFVVLATALASGCASRARPTPIAVATIGHESTSTEGAPSVDPRASWPGDAIEALSNGRDTRGCVGSSLSAFDFGACVCALPKHSKASGSWCGDTYERASLRGLVWTSLEPEHTIVHAGESTHATWTVINHATTPMGLVLRPNGSSLFGIRDAKNRLVSLVDTCMTSFGGSRPPHHFFVLVPGGRFTWTFAWTASMHLRRDSKRTPDEVCADAIVPLEPGRYEIFFAPPIAEEHELPQAFGAQVEVVP